MGLPEPHEAAATRDSVGPLHNWDDAALEVRRPTQPSRMTNRLIAGSLRFASSPQAGHVRATTGSHDASSRASSSGGPRIGNALGVSVLGALDPQEVDRRVVAGQPKRRSASLCEPASMVPGPAWSGDRIAHLCPQAFSRVSRSRKYSDSALRLTKADRSASDLGPTNVPKESCATRQSEGAHGDDESASSPERTTTNEAALGH